MHLIGTSEAIRIVNEDIDSAARSSAKVLITGETGVGKEVVARLIHARSSQRSAPMVAVNCAGVPDSLLESELFGHMRGSFTGAYRDKPGLLESAQSGTIFLDEVGEMSVRMQAVLLRFLETGELQRVGADRAHTRVNVRVVAATNRDLLAQVASGAFREDLYYRLNVIRIYVPPVRDRREDIPELVSHFLDMYSQTHRTTRPELAEPTLETLVAYRWPGNIRELKNCAERIVLRYSGTPVTPRDLPPEIRAVPAPTKPVSSDAVDPAFDLIAQLNGGESFWSVVYPAFIRRDITRDTVRQIVSHGLRQAAGNYRVVVELFNMPASDYKRFLSFLRKYDCQVPFRTFRAPSVVRGVEERPYRVEEKAAV